MVAPARLPPIHPGELLREDYGIRVAADPSWEAILSGKAPVTREMASRIASVTNTLPQFWLNVQARYDAEMAEDRTTGLAPDAGEGEV